MCSYNICDPFVSSVLASINTISKKNAIIRPSTRPYLLLFHNLIISQSPLVQQQIIRHQTPPLLSRRPFHSNSGDAFSQPLRPPALLLGFGRGGQSYRPRLRHLLSAIGTTTRRSGAPDGDDLCAREKVKGQI